MNQGMVFAPGAGVPVPPSSGSTGSGSGGGSVGASAWKSCATYACVWLRSTSKWGGCCESDIAGHESKARKCEKSDGRKCLQNVPMQCGSNFDRATQIQQLLQGLNARELQQVFSEYSKIG